MASPISLLRDSIRLRTERWRIERDMRASRPRRGPRLVQIGITERCNFRCLMCAAHSPLVANLPDERRRPEMPLAVFGSLIEDLRALGTGWVDFVGIGEPLHHPGFFEMAAWVKAAGMGLNVSTNGSLLTAEKAQRLADMGIDSINLSLNAGSDAVYREVHQTASGGTRERVLDSLKAMKAYCDRTGTPRPRLVVSAVILKTTYRDLDAVVRSGAAVGAASVSFLPLMAVPETQHLVLDAREWGEARDILQACDGLAAEAGIRTNASALLASEQPDVARDLHRRVSCYAGHVFALVFADGRVRFCCGCDETTGNLHRETFRRVWRGSAYARMRRMALDLPKTGQAPPTCACLGYCPHAQHNIAVHNWLHPQSAVPAPVVLDSRFLPAPCSRPS